MEDHILYRLQIPGPHTARAADLQGSSQCMSSLAFFHYMCKLVSPISLPQVQPSSHPTQCKQHKTCSWVIHAQLLSCGMGSPDFPDEDAAPYSCPASHKQIGSRTCKKEVEPGHSSHLSYWSSEGSSSWARAWAALQHWILCARVCPWNMFLLWTFISSLKWTSSFVLARPSPLPSSHPLLHLKLYLLLQHFPDFLKDCWIRWIH